MLVVAAGSKQTLRSCTILLSSPYKKGVVMGRQYTSDGGLGDFMQGQATGVGYNFYSSLGAQYHKPYSPPPSRIIPLPSSSKDYPLAGPPLPLGGTSSSVATSSLTIPRRMSVWDRWIWNLSDTLTKRFDDLADSAIDSIAWWFLVTATALAGGVLASGFLPATQFWPVVASWATAWWHVVMVVVAGGLAGAAAPFLVLLVLRGVIWLVGKSVTIGAGLAVLAIAGTALVVTGILLWKLLVVFV
ncbi:MAG: hypothetical protein WCH04_04260 [Gammaproteobacteria bacterium]